MSPIRRVPHLIDNLPLMRQAPFMSAHPAIDRNTAARPAVDAPLHCRVRAHLILRGTTLAAWCHRRGIDPSWTAQALRYQRNGPAAQKLRRDLRAAVGLDE